jgi:hypothetical protein
MSGHVKYSEEVVRLPALTAEGKPCEILERITLGREIQADGSLGEPSVVNRRFDLKTGERVNHLGGDEFEMDDSGDRLKACRQVNIQKPV